MEKAREIKNWYDQRKKDRANQVKTVDHKKCIPAKEYPVNPIKYGQTN